jgi:hypothetical protein
MTTIQAAGSPAKRAGRRAVTAFTAGLAGSAVLGLIGGLIWGEVAPRALLQEVGAGEAELVSAETHAFIVADLWFSLIALVAGLITGVLGYRYLVARNGSAVVRQGQSTDGQGARVAATAGLVLGALAGALVMMWLGGQIGLSGFNHALAASRNGTLFNDSLGLGAKSALAFWPLATSAVILVAEWSYRRATPPPAPVPATPGPFGFPQPGQAPPKEAR